MTKNKTEFRAIKYKYILTQPVKSNISHCNYNWMDAGMHNFFINKSSPYCIYMYWCLLAQARSGKQASSEINSKNCTTIIINNNFNQFMLFKNKKSWEGVGQMKKRGFSFSGRNCKYNCKRIIKKSWIFRKGNSSSNRRISWTKN